MTTVSQILQVKGNKVVTVDVGMTVYDAIKVMADNNIGAVAVTDDGKLAGIFSERDYARKVILQGKASPDINVAEIMTANPVCVVPDRTVDQCMALMTDKAIRHLPVLQDNRLIGMISIGDLVKSMIEEKDHIIDQLEHYIAGS